MPLFDHFHGPLSDRPWTSVHFQWGGAIAADLNRRLPTRFVAETPFRLGTTVEADVAERERLDDVRRGPSHGTPAFNQGGGVAVAAEPQLTAEPGLYEPPETALQMSAAFPDELLVLIKDRTANWKVVGVVEVVSPGNKKERAERDQFVAKCMSYLGGGIGLVVLDVVTSHHRNLHNELVRLAGHDPRLEFPDDPPTYAVSYRPVRRQEQNLIDLWRWPLAVGAALPAVPLPLTGFGCVRLDLEATYAEACARCRIP